MSRNRQSAIKRAREYEPFEGQKFARHDTQRLDLKIKQLAQRAQRAKTPPFILAAEEGDIEALEYFHGDEDQTDDNALAQAAYVGTLNSVQWLYNHGYISLFHDAFNFAVDQNHYDVAIWLWNQDQVSTEFDLIEDDLIDFPDAIKWIFANYDSDGDLYHLVIDAVIEDEKEVLNFLVYQEIYPMDEIVAILIRFDRLDLLKEFNDEFTYTKREFDLAMEYDRKEITAWLNNLQ
jgi:hypothetical protein